MCKSVLDLIGIGFSFDLLSSLNEMLVNEWIKKVGMETQDLVELRRHYVICSEGSVCGVFDCLVQPQSESEATTIFLLCYRISTCNRSQ